MTRTDHRESASGLDPVSTASHAAAALGPDAIYRALLDGGTFEIQRCDDCGRWQFYPRLLCRFCGSTRWQWTAPSGSATVYATTVVRRKASEGGDYNVAIVELDEGPRMMTRVDGVPAEQVSIGMKVTAKVVSEDGAALLVFFAGAKQEVPHG